jgi:hypothetical protein
MPAIKPPKQVSIRSSSICLTMTLLPGEGPEDSNNEEAEAWFQARSDPIKKAWTLDRNCRGGSLPFMYQRTAAICVLSDVVCGGGRWRRMLSWRLIGCARSTSRLCAPCATARSDCRASAVVCSEAPDSLRAPAERRGVLCGPHPARRQARRPAGAGAGQIPYRTQP